MKRTALLAISAAAISAAYAGAPTTKRINEIWESATSRFSRQTDAWFREGDYPRAVQLLRFHASIDPKDQEIATNLGWMLENIEQYDQALAVYIQLRKANPKEPDAAWPEANYYFRKKAYAKVPSILEPTLKGKEPHANTFRILAHSYEKMNMLSDSKRVWQMYIAKHPEDLVAKNNLNRVLKKLKEGFSKKT